MSEPAHAIVVFDVENLLALADQHASDSDNIDCERDDLRAMLTASWAAIGPDQRRAFIDRVRESQAVEGAGADWHEPPTLEGDAAIVWLKQIAEDHGEEEPDHEVGDLQVIFRLLWPHLTIEEQRVAFASEDFVALLKSGGFDEFPASAEHIDGEEWGEALEHFGLDPSFQYGEAQSLDVVRAHRIAVAIPEANLVHTIPLAKRR